MEERFGAYRLVRKLAVGGMAEVFLGVQTGIEGFEREVVIKRILPHRAQDAEFCTMFLDEARLVAKLSHPNIAQIYDLGRVDESFFIAMEHVRGPDLARLLDVAAEQGAPGLPDTVAIPVIATLCEALHFIHTRTDELGRPLNIVHRDLNPKNVIVSYDGAVKLIDFGIAKAASQVYETRTGVIKGTYGYMAPEQVTKRRPIDSRADLFALGVLTYELTTGRHPFDATDEVAVLTKLVRGDFSPPSQAVSAYPRELERIVLSLMRLDAERRPATAREVIGWLERYATTKRLPMTMSRIADYVRLQVPPDEHIDGVPPSASIPSMSTALVSQRLAARADHDQAELATELLREGEPERRLPLDMLRERTSRRPAAAPPRPPPPKAMPWSSWGRRERAVALSAAAAVGLAAVATVAIVGALGQPDEAPRPPAVRDGPTLAAPAGPAGSSEDPAGGHGGSTGQRPAEAETNLLHVQSAPAGAEILVEGRSTGSLTPALVAVPVGQRLVWVRVELLGHLPEERQIEVSAGAAVFTLRSERDEPALDEPAPVPDDEPL